MEEPLADAEGLNDGPTKFFEGLAVDIMERQGEWVIVINDIHRIVDDLVDGGWEMVACGKHHVGIDIADTIVRDDEAFDEFLHDIGLD